MPVEIFSDGINSNNTMSERTTALFFCFIFLFFFLFLKKNQ